MTERPTSTGWIGAEYQHQTTPFMRRHSCGAIHAAPGAPTEHDPVAPTIPTSSLIS